jgi:hypothetical protein
MADIKTFYPNTIDIALSVDDQNQSADSQVWTGTAAEYAALGSKDANTLYFVTA